MLRQAIKQIWYTKKEKINHSSKKSEIISFYLFRDNTKNYAWQRIMPVRQNLITSIDQFERKSSLF